MSNNRWSWRHLVLPNIHAATRSLGSPVRDAISGGIALRKILSSAQARHAPCQKCGERALRRIVAEIEIQDAAGLSTSHPTLECSSCGHKVAIMKEITAPETLVKAKVLRASGNHMLLSACALTVFSAGWSAYNHAWATLVGGSLIGFMVALQALVQRYRAWQIENGRLYEIKAPILDWIRWELLEDDA